MAKLIFIGEKFNGRIYEFAVEKTTVGRGDHNTLTIHDPSVSHSHCEILVFGPEVIVRDLGSSNGTLVDGVLLRDQQRPLHAGQTVKFGAVAARLELESSSTSDTDTDVTAVYSHARHSDKLLNKAKSSSPAQPTLDAGHPTAPEGHTLLLQQPAPPVDKIARPLAPKAADTVKLARKPKIAWVVATIVVVLVIVCWLVLARNR